MRPRAEIRHQNLETLIQEAGSARQLAQRAGTSSSYLSQLRSRKGSQAKRRRGIGDRLADRLERGMGKAPGWLDQSHDDDARDESANKLPATHCPVLDWGQVTDWLDGTIPRNAESLQTLLCPLPCGPDTFVVRASDDSMAPKFDAGEYLFVDPAVTPRTGRYVVVRSEPSHHWIVRQLIDDGAHRYLRALNPDWPQPIVEIGCTADIRGVVIFKGHFL